jgi:hypothetical protein
MGSTVSYVVFAETVRHPADVSSRLVETLEQAFAQIVCRCGLAYQFEQDRDGWRLVLTDVAKPTSSPAPIVSTYLRPQDAQHDLLEQAVDGRLRGHIAMSLENFKQRRRIN